MFVVVACEYSGVVREAFRKKGHEAWSCDLLPADDNSEYHYQGDIKEFLASPPQKVDLAICHPPCTYLCSSGMHWTTRGLRDPQLTEDAMEFFRYFLELDIPKIAVENPVGIVSKRIRPPDQYVHPWWFGDDASKKTGLWLKGLPLLTPTQIIPGRIIDGKTRWANQTDSGQNKLGPSEDRWKERSKTYPGLAAAMADTWG